MATANANPGANIAPGGACLTKMLQKNSYQPALQYQKQVSNLLLSFNRCYLNTAPRGALTQYYIIPKVAKCP
jgi:hypothetical protein